GDTNSDGKVDQNDIVIEVNGANEARFRIKITQSVTALNSPIDFDISLPGLGLSVDAPAAVHVDLGYTFNFGFGVSRADGFYFDTSPADDMTVTAHVTLPNFVAHGKIGFLRITAADNPATPTAFDANFTVQLTDPFNTGKLTHNEITGGNFNLGDIVSA